MQYKYLICKIYDIRPPRVHNPRVENYYNVNIQFSSFWNPFYSQKFANSVKIFVLIVTAYLHATSWNDRNILTSSLGKALSPQPLFPAAGLAAKWDFIGNNKSLQKAEHVFEQHHAIKTTQLKPEGFSVSLVHPGSHIKIR